MTPQELYQQKKKTVAEALSLVRSGDTIVGGTYVCEPLQLYRALHTIADRVRDVTVWLGITTENYPFCSDPAYEDAFFVNSFFYDAQARSNHRRGRISYVPFHLHQMPAGIAAQKPDIFMTAVPPMDKDGYFYLTPIQQIEAEMFQAVPTRILEVNPRLPICAAPASVSVWSGLSASLTRIFGRNCVGRLRHCCCGRPTSS